MSKEEQEALQGNEQKVFKSISKNIELNNIGEDISNNDGYLNGQVIPSKDTLINANTFVRLARNNYSKQQLNKINAILAASRE